MVIVEDAEEDPAGCFHVGVQPIVSTIINCTLQSAMVPWGISRNVILRSTSEINRIFQLIQFLSRTIPRYGERDKSL